MRTYKQNIPDRELDDNFNEEADACLSCGIVSDLDSNERCYDCGYADAHEYERENEDR